MREVPRFAGDYKERRGREGLVWSLPSVSRGRFLHARAAPLLLTEKACGPSGGGVPFPGRMMYSHLALLLHILLDFHLRRGHYFHFVVGESEAQGVECSAQILQVESAATASTGLFPSPTRVGE